MDILNNSIVDTVIEYANVKFGVELEKDAVASNLKELSYSQTLSLVDAIKDEDNEKFTDFVDLSAVNEGWSILPDIDREKYQERDGLEGPIMTKSGKVVYYDPKEGNYYDPDRDMYITYDEWKALDEGVWDAAKNIASKVGNAVKNVVTPGAVKKARQTKSIGKQGSLAKQINMPGFGESEESSEPQAITEEEFDVLAEKKDACYHKVKARYKVWPSAYASGALVQCRKKGAANWGNKSKK